MSKYKNYTNDQLEEHFSNFLIDSWSYSKVSSFARNEKEFERVYIYRERGKFSASTVAGNAYHEGLQLFFSSLHEGVLEDLPALEKKAFEYIDHVRTDDWKTQKTTPTVEDCIAEASKKSKILLLNFYKEMNTYIEDINVKFNICNENI